MDNIKQSIQYKPNGTITVIHWILSDSFAIESIEIHEIVTMDHCISCNPSLNIIA